MLQVGREHLQAVVELVKDDYLVLSLPKHRHALGFAAITDYNLQHQKGSPPFQLGQQVPARVAALPSDQSGMGKAWGFVETICSCPLHLIVISLAALVVGLNLWWGSNW